VRSWRIIVKHKIEIGVANQIVKGVSYSSRNAIRTTLKRINGDFVLSTAPGRQPLRDGIVALAIMNETPSVQVPYYFVVLSA